MVFNFDEWAQLAARDTAAFEQKRAATLRQAIAESACSERERRRLDGLQFKVDMVRRKHKTPLGACIALSEMLMQQVSQLACLDINTLQSEIKDMADSKSTHNVIPFPRPD
jgi:phage FluMu protein gp41